MACPAARRLRLALIIIAGAVGFGGCYLYRTPTATQPVVAAAVLPHVLVVSTREYIAAERDPVMERAAACGRI